MNRGSNVVKKRWAFGLAALLLMLGFASQAIGQDDPPSVPLPPPAEMPAWIGVGDSSGELAGYVQRDELYQPPPDLVAGDLPLAPSWPTIVYENPDPASPPSGVVTDVGFIGLGFATPAVTCVVSPQCEVEPQDGPIEVWYDEVNGVCLRLAGGQSLWCSGVPPDSPVGVWYEEPRGLCFTVAAGDAISPHTYCSNESPDSPVLIWYDIVEDRLCISVATNPTNTFCAGPQDVQPPAGVWVSGEEGVCISVATVPPKTWCSGPLPT